MPNPRIFRAKLRGKTIEELMEMLQAAVDADVYSQHDLDKIKAKIEKRVLQQQDLLNDDQMIDDLFDGLNLGD